eukprot:310274_1
MMQMGAPAPPYYAPPPPQMPPPQGPGQTQSEQDYYAQFYAAYGYNMPMQPMQSQTQPNNDGGNDSKNDGGNDSKNDGDNKEDGTNNTQPQPQPQTNPYGQYPGYVYYSYP